MALHQCAGIVSGSGTAGSTAFGPLAAFVAGRQQVDGFLEVFLHLIHDLVEGVVGGIETVKRRIGAVVCDQWHVLIISGQIVVSQCTQEQQLSLDVLHALTQLAVIITGTGEAEVADVDGIVPLTPNPPADVAGDGKIEVIERKIPHL